MDDFYSFAVPDDDPGKDLSTIIGLNNPRDTKIQIVLSLSLGISAFFAFCFLRPRWPGLYAARKRQKYEANALPELPNSMFGWILPLWRITDQQLLASAGLDAYIFLTFFKMAIKFLLTTLLFSLIVIKPVHDAYPDDDDKKKKDGEHSDDPEDFSSMVFNPTMKRSSAQDNVGALNYTMPSFGDLETDYLWMYVVFAYLFSAIAMYLVISTTRKVIEVRQEFLGAQTTVTDRTIRLSGIPVELQDEDKIKEFIENLEIGHVQKVLLCRNWKELDEAMSHRMDMLRRLEEVYTVYHGNRRVERNQETLPIAQPTPPDPGTDDVEAGEDTETALIGSNGSALRPYGKTRPRTTIRYGWLRLRRRRVDAISYYEKKLQEADERVKELRKSEFPTTPVAFVTLDSVAACQMAIQAVLDPSPLHLIANQSPDPASIIWENTYMSRRSRVMRNWTVTALIVTLTIFWSAVFVPVAGLLNVETIGKVFPGLAQVLEDHENVRSLINTQLPTLIASLLTVLVPYLYYYLSWRQGQISKGDIELSAISKNFFFTFFNFFIIFTVLGTASKFYTIFKYFGDAIRDFQKVAYTLAYSLQKLLGFYVNFIILQGVGLFPFRLLEVGTVSLYPIMLIGAKTPRDYAELVQPPTFNYGFYLPNAMLIFIICMVYSVLRESWEVLLAGLLYFSLGHYCYKYQLLYAMDHPQQTSGRAWVMICDRIFVGMILFQLTTTGQLLLKQAFARSALMVPLIIATIWISVVYGRTYKPLMRYIALSAVRRGQVYERYTDRGDASPRRYASSLNSTNLAPETSIWAGRDAAATEAYSEGRAGVQGDPSERNLPFINPSLVAPLHGVWIADKDPGTVPTQARLIDDDDEDNGADEGNDNGRGGT
jgi:hypothetical protein